MTTTAISTEALARLYQRDRGKPRTADADAVFRLLSLRVRDLGTFACDGLRYTWHRGAGSFVVTKAVGFNRAISLSHLTGRREGGSEGTYRTPRVYRYVGGRLD